MDHRHWEDTYQESPKMSEDILDYAGFEKVLKNLECYHGTYLEQRRIDVNPKIEEMHQMAVIKSFEICYAVTLKALRRHLSDELGVPDLGDGAKPIFRAADRNGLLSGGAERWFEYVKAYYMTSHEHDIAKFGHVMELIPAFLDDAVKLYEMITGVPWEKK